MLRGLGLAGFRVCGTPLPVETERALGFRVHVYLVHGWDRIKHVRFYSLLGLSTLKNVKRFPTMIKFLGLGWIGLGGHLEFTLFAKG